MLRIMFCFQYLLFLVSFAAVGSTEPNSNVAKNSRVHRIKTLEEIYNNPSVLRLPESEEWTGRWFPDIKPTASVEGEDAPGNMGKFDASCDDGKTNLAVDWDLSPLNYTCFNADGFYNPDFSVRPVKGIQHIPPLYHAMHRCMNQTIKYGETITTFGPHRPAWARYGEYKFIPRQRWLHNVEHGAVVMLYHPCAHPTLVAKLRFLVTMCLYRHIITPYNLLDEKRPLALVTWGHYLLMNSVSSRVVKEFIKETALSAPENIGQDGPYDYLLKKPAKLVTDYNDTHLCPSILLDE